MISQRKLYKYIPKIPILLLMIGMLMVLYESGVEKSAHVSGVFQWAYFIIFCTALISITIRYLPLSKTVRIKVLMIDIILAGILTILIISFFSSGFLHQVLSFENGLIPKLSVFLYFGRELFAMKPVIKRATLSPAQLFVFSFFAVILAGTALLMLPKATYAHLSFIDSLFTSTSAVCVTGLIVVDTGSFFTPFGQSIILILIQIGGIGIMTFASYFSYFFKGAASYEGQLQLGEITNTQKLSEVYGILKRIILITILIEAVGAWFMYQTLDSELIKSVHDRVFFSAFHAVSGFCNAGFSTLPNSFYQDTFQFNYPLHLIIATLIILGGLGFPIALNLLRYLKNQTYTKIKNLILHRRQIHQPRIINLNTRIVLITTAILITTGFFFFLIFEQNNTLKDHSFWGKIVTAFFGSVTTRTAGFNTVDTAMLSMPMVMIVMFLMWVGASPGSTGGGIKTSSLAIAVLNIRSIAKGKKRLELYGREIAKESINRSFAIIFLSLTAIAISTFSISTIQSHLKLSDVAFECISAFSTVGLSRGITSELTAASKTILIATMFVGRVGFLTFLLALSKKDFKDVYRYPTENILIN